MQIDAHHHLWNLRAVDYPWLMERGAVRFFGDPSPIQKDYLMETYRASASAEGFSASVHIQVGAADPWAEALWVQSVADAHPDWFLAQVVFADLTDEKIDRLLERYKGLKSVRGVRQIVGRAPGEDALSGTQALLDDRRFLEGLRRVCDHGLSFDLQLIPELMEKAAQVLEQVPNLDVALCHAGSPHDRSLSGLNLWSEHLRRLSDLPHVRCKLSGLGMFQPRWTPDDFAPIVATCLEQFGADRCLFGSNFPVDSLYSDYATLVRAFKRLVPKNDHEHVFEKTAQDFYRIA